MRDLKWRRNPEAPRVVNVLIMEDLVMAPYLPVVTVLLTGASLASGLISVAVALSVVGVLLFIAMRAHPKFGRLFNTGDPVGLMLIVFGAAIAAAGAASLAGFSPQVAAFLVGLLLTGEVAAVARRRLDPLRDLLAAIFFVYFGLTTDPREIPGVFWPALALAIITLGTKMLTGWTISRGSLGNAARVRAGLLLGARGEFSVVIAGLALTSTVLPENFHALVATYVILTATAAPLMARAAGRPPEAPVPAAAVGPAI